MVIFTLQDYQNRRTLRACSGLRGSGCGRSQWRRRSFISTVRGSRAGFGCDCISNHHSIEPFLNLDRNGTGSGGSRATEVTFLRSCTPSNRSNSSFCRIRSLISSLLKRNARPLREFADFDHQLVDQLLLFFRHLRIGLVNRRYRGRRRVCDGHRFD